MSDKDRFEQIKNDYYECDLDCKDIEWLIERVEQLQKDIERLQDIEYELTQKLQEEQWNFLECNRERNEYKRQLQKAQAKAERYAKALRKIIDESICRGEDCTWGDTCYAVIARKALEGER
jgi:chromosome segregation ATPase